MKAIMIDEHNKSTGIFEFAPSQNFKSVVPIAMSDDDEVIKKLHDKLTPTKHVLTAEIVATMKKLYIEEEYQKVKAMIKNYLGMDVCCTGVMENVLNTL